jgi:hypothetical protein
MDLPKRVAATAFRHEDLHSPDYPGGRGRGEGVIPCGVARAEYLSATYGPLCAHGWLDDGDVQYGGWDLLWGELARGD